ncbi:MAG TPA: hypothetical protein DEP66_06045, partial [Acidimicrobiaceae bacterium]|nr:hypothetical protein [Acidimicrobiaceae bacterium]
PAPALPETPSSQPRPAPGPRSGPRSGLFWTLVSGVAYGVGLSVLIDTTAASGTWPIVGQRVAGCALMFAVVSVLRLPP